MLGLGEPNAQLQPPRGDAWGDEWEFFLDRLFLASTGEAGMGLPQIYTQYDGPLYQLDISSQDTTDGKALRAISQNGSYGHEVNNAGFSITGAPTLNAFTTGSVLFVGASKVLSQDNSNFFWDDAANSLNALNLIVPTKAAIGASSLGAEVLTVTGNARVSTFLGVGGAPDSTHALVVTGLSKFTSRGGFGGDPDATAMLKVTGGFIATGAAALQLGAAVTGGNLTVGTGPKFSVDYANGNIYGAGTFTVDGDVQVGVSKFTVAASTGNTVVAGTLGITGNITHDTNLILTDVTNDKVSINATPSSTTSKFEVNGQVRVTSSTGGASTGVGLEIYYHTPSGSGNILPYDRSGATAKDLNVYGLTMTLNAGSSLATKIKLDGTGIGFNNSGTVAKGNITGVRTGTLAQLQTVVANMLSYLASRGDWTDSTT